MKQKMLISKSRISYFRTAYPNSNEINVRYVLFICGQ